MLWPALTDELGDFQVQIGLASNLSHRLPRLRLHVMKYANF